MKKARSINSNSEKAIWIFLSYSNKDFDQVRKIRNYLEEKDCRPLMFYLKCLSDKDEINALIRREIDCRTRFIICQSKHSLASKWVQSEVYYIRDRGRKYEIIDLDYSEAEINKILDNVISQSKMFIAYYRNEEEFVQKVITHLKKYDTRLSWMTQEDILAEQEQIEINKETIFDEIANSRKFVLFANRQYFQSEFCNEKVNWAFKKGTPISVLWLDDYSLSRDFNCQFQIEHEEDLSKINNIDDKINKAIETIVSWFMSCQDIYVMAENMRKGLDCPKDRKEARRLFGIAYKMAKALVEKGDKEAILVLARCEAKGYGTEKDLKQALIDYQKYEEFCANCKERKVDKALQSEINAVRKKDSDH